MRWATRREQDDPRLLEALAMLDRLTSLLVALSLACLVWLYARSRDQDILDNVPVPVDISLSPGQEDQYELEVTGPSQILASFTGPPSRIRELRNLLQHGEPRVAMVVSIPDDQVEASRVLDTVHIEASDIHPPPGVTPMVPEGRNRIPVVFHRLAERQLPVWFDHASSEVTGQFKIEPATVKVRGPADVLDRARYVSTQPHLLPSSSEPAQRKEAIDLGLVPLVRELEGHRIRTFPAEVDVQVVLQPRQKSFELADVPVQFLCPPNFAFRPLFADERAGKITVRVLGPAGEEQPSVLAYVDLCGRKWEAGLYEEPLKLQLPQGFKLDSKPPRLAAFQLLSTEAASKPAGAGQ
jgi:hypothetical protein